MSTTELVRFDTRGPVGLLTINRPEALNAVNADVSTALGEALVRLDADSALRVGVITGEGRAFCAGADLKAIAAGESFLSPTHPEWGFAGIVRHYVEKPLIAAINGFAFGGGTEIVLACDLAVISAEASLGLPEVTRGLVAGAGGLIRLPDQVPPKIAAEAILTGEPISALAALRWGLVNVVVAPDQVLPEALRFAERIGANAPMAVTTSKRVMARRHDFGSDWGEPMWHMNDEELDRILSSADAAEGAAAFAQKRSPQWSGR
ncbi:enoyl-CoA hydratase [Rhodococcus qingshengii]|uniref:crotonase/enoyl-CoA hydratase family protein n=1 Tax=Rhodococcus qingshengii TaxID=334542 RepID=UPI0007E57322|nr:crotonase/enoyl-CoA hydratase family protein [Rhodococcus qingshengii]BCF83297.1 enoyl-CoA hydratase [Rhodococcus qingshengii]